MEISTKQEEKQKHMMFTKNKKNATLTQNRKFFTRQTLNQFTLVLYFNIKFFQNEKPQAYLFPKQAGIRFFLNCVLS